VPESLGLPTGNSLLIQRPPIVHRECRLHGHVVAIGRPEAAMNQGRQCRHIQIPKAAGLDYPGTDQTPVYADCELQLHHPLFTTPHRPWRVDRSTGIHIQDSRILNWCRTRGLRTAHRRCEAATRDQGQCERKETAALCLFVSRCGTAHAVFLFIMAHLQCFPSLTKSRSPLHIITPVIVALGNSITEMHSNRVTCCIFRPYSPGEHSP